MSKIFLLRSSLVLAVICFQAYSLYSQTLHNYSEEYPVYDALLEQMFATGQIEQLVIEGATKPDGLYIDNPKVQKKLIARFSDTTEDFIMKNKISYDLDNKFDLGIKINLLRGLERKNFFDELNANYYEWEKVFGEKYPKSGNQIISLSRVGFNSNKTRALLHLGYQCGWTCGEGNYILLIKKEEKWKIKKKSMTWIS